MGIVASFERISKVAGISAIRVLGRMVGCLRSGGVVQRTRLRVYLPVIPQVISIRNGGGVFRKVRNLSSFISHVRMVRMVVLLPSSDVTVVRGVVVRIDLSEDVRGVRTRIVYLVVDDEGVTHRGVVIELILVSYRVRVDGKAVSI